MMITFRRRKVPLLALPLLLAAAALLALWADGAASRHAAEAEVQVVRWFDVTVTIPDGSGLVYAESQDIDNRPVLLIGSPKNVGIGIAVDALTGEVLKNNARPEDQAAIDQVVKSVSVSPLDVTTAPWPYNGEPPTVRPEGSLETGFIQPDPASGIMWARVFAYSVGEPVSFIRFSNGRSTMAVGEGRLISKNVVLEDRTAFDRLLATFELIETEP